MTTKEIAEIAGVSTKTVIRTAKINGIGIIKTGAETVFSEKEAVCLMAELRKKGFVQPRQNVEVPRQNDYVTKSDMKDFGIAIVSEMMRQIIPMIQNGQPTQARIASHAEAPQLDLRAQLRQLMNNAAKLSGDYSGVWNTLYNEIYYRLRLNVGERAKNSGVNKLDILEAEGQLMNAILIAREIFK